MTRYFVYDVFTDGPFGGNQLAVIPDATALPEDALQKIAREFNYSESTFVYPPADPTNTARVRIFTPTMEIPFAGHPTIGTAVALKDEGQLGPMTLELGVGPIPCAFEGKTAAFTVTAPLDCFSEPEQELVAAALSLPSDAIKTETHVPTQAGVGLPFVIVELASKTHLNACLPAIAYFREGAAKYPAGIDFAIFAYVREGQKVEARMFAPLDNIPEDPATGSACAAVAALLTKTLDQDLDLTILQGEAMGRPSHLRAQTKAGSQIAVTISGQAVRTMEGVLTLDLA